MSVRKEPHRLTSVAPLVGAWIEILSTSKKSRPRSVAPLVGAWIEILMKTSLVRIRPVAPLVGAWIEMGISLRSSLRSSSLLSWERGLKCSGSSSRRCKSRSLLSWERGLKSTLLRRYPSQSSVAPLVGAWIEIPDASASLAFWIRRSSRGSVD